MQERKYREHPIYNEMIFELPLEQLVGIVEPRKQTWSILNREFMLEDIRINGLKTPILVDKFRVNDIWVVDKWVVMQGQHRLSCMKKLGYTKIPCQRIPKRSDYLKKNDFTPETVMIPIAQIHPTERNRMKELFSEYRKTFVEDIKKNGIRCPIYVSWYSLLGKYRILDGNHRYYTALMLGIVEVPCRIYDPKHDLDIRGIIGIERKKGWEGKQG